MGAPITGSEYNRENGHGRPSPYSEYCSRYIYLNLFSEHDCESGMGPPLLIQNTIVRTDMRPHDRVQSIVLDTQTLDRFIN